MPRRWQRPAPHFTEHRSFINYSILRGTKHGLGRCIRDAAPLEHFGANASLVFVDGQMIPVVTDCELRDATQMHRGIAEEKSE